MLLNYSLKSQSILIDIYYMRILSCLHSTFWKANIYISNKLSSDGPYPLDKRTLAVASRVRIHAMHMQGIGNREIIGKRWELKYLIAQSLLEQDALPKTGLIHIKEFAFYHWQETRNDPWIIASENGEQTPIKNRIKTFSCFKIWGFKYLGESYSLKYPIPIERSVWFSKLRKY